MLEAIIECSKPYIKQRCHPRDYDRGGIGFGLWKHLGGIGCLLF